MRQHGSDVPGILYVDDDILAVNKPAGVLSVPGRGEAPSIVEQLRESGLVPADSELRIVHRLDRGASGVMVLARNLTAQRQLTAQWGARQVEKVYLALVGGIVSEDGQIDLPLRVDRDRQLVAPDRREGKPAITRYRVVERFPGHTLLECFPITGRLHQIRVHLASIGHPLSVDPRYGGGRSLLLSKLKPGYRRSRHEERPLIDRLTLHALRVTFRHPTRGTPLTVEAPVPKDLRAAMAQLRKIGTPRQLD